MPITALPHTPPDAPTSLSPDPLLFQIDGDFEAFRAIVHLLSQASTDSSIGLNHALLGNAEFYEVYVKLDWGIDCLKLITNADDLKFL